MAATTDGKRQFPTNDKGEYVRKDSSFRNVISNEPGNKFTPEKDRYHLYVSLACPWAHRTLIVRALKGLNDLISVSVVDHFMGKLGWRFAKPEDGIAGATEDHLYGSEYLRELYFKVDPNYDGRFTVPVLWDKKLHTIVNNESSEIIRMFNEGFNDLLPSELQKVHFYPQHLRKDIDELNAWVYDTVNNGVYKSGFATTQSAYETNCKKVFESLDRLEQILSNHEYLVGDTFSEADIRLFTTMVRFDPVYHGHFKCNIKSVAHDYPHILKWMRKIYKMPGIAETVNMTHIKCHYYKSHYQINPSGVVPLGNGPDLTL